MSVHFGETLEESRLSEVTGSSRRVDGPPRVFYDSTEFRFPFSGERDGYGVSRPLGPTLRHDGGSLMTGGVEDRFLVLYLDVWFLPSVPTGLVVSSTG